MAGIAVQAKVPAFAFSCLFYRLTGLYCPGCGGTRALYALVYGHPLRSFFYHPIICYAIFSAICGIVFHFTKKTAPKQILINILFGAVIILLLNFNVRNILLLLGMPTL